MRNPCPSPSAAVTLTLFKGGERFTSVARISNSRGPHSADVAEGFTAEELSDWLDKRMGDKKQPLSWSHFRTVSPLMDKTQRDALLEQALDESMTVAQLKKTMEGESTNDRGTAADPTKGQARIGKGLRSIRGIIEADLRSRQRWDQLVIAPLDQGEKIDDGLRQEAATTLESLEAARDHYGKMATELRSRMK